MNLKVESSDALYLEGVDAMTAISNTDLDSLAAVVAGSLSRDEIRVLKNLGAHAKSRISSTELGSKPPELALVLDLDHTLIQSKDLLKWIPEKQIPCSTDVMVNKIRTTLAEKPYGDDLILLDMQPASNRNSLGKLYLCKLRKGVRQFLECVSKYYRLYVYTAANRAYKLAVVQALDSEKSLFCKTLSRDDYPDLEEIKMLSLLCESLNPNTTLIFDDKPDVWATSQNLVLQASAFGFLEENRSALVKYFIRKTGAPGDDSREPRLPTDYDEHLDYMSRVFEDLAVDYKRRFKTEGSSPSLMAEVLEERRMKVLDGVKIVFSGLQHEAQLSLGERTRRFGGSIVEYVELATHVVAMKVTKKVFDAERLGSPHVVHPLWLEFCFSTWTNADAAPFGLRKFDMYPLNDVDPSKQGLSKLPMGADWWAVKLKAERKKNMDSALSVL